MIPIKTIVKFNHKLETGFLCLPDPDTDADSKKYQNPDKGRLEKSDPKRKKIYSTNNQSPPIRPSEKTNLKYKRSDLRGKGPSISALRLDLVGLR